MKNKIVRWHPKEKESDTLDSVYVFSTKADLEITKTTWKKGRNKPSTERKQDKSNTKKRKKK